MACTTADLTAAEIEAKIAQYEARLYDYIRNTSELSPGMLQTFAKDIDTLNHMWHSAMVRADAEAADAKAVAAR